MKEINETIEVYFDFISPYAYLGWMRLLNLQEEQSLGIQPVPVLYAGLLNHWGLMGPAEVPVRRNFIFRDVVREARSLGIPFQGARVHPFNPLLPLRLALAETSPERQQELITLLFQAIWTNSIDPRSPEDLTRLLEQSGFPAETLVNRTRESTVKEALRSHTQKAIEAGVFGVPTFSWNTFLFWGQDRLKHLEMALEDPRFAEGEALVDEILSRPRAAVRKQ